MRICPECGTRTDAKVCPKDGLITLDEAVFEHENPLIGRKVADKYEILAEIGAGGMGSVYRARHAETGGFVAVKVMAPDRADRPTAIKRFHLEAQNAAVLRHANTVRVLDFGVDDDLLYLVMEYLAGEPLSAVLKREGKLPWPRAAHIGRQVLKAIWEAHEHPRRIVHRDIKPANVFLCEQVGDEDFVKVVDFGVARSMEGTGAGTAGAIGTPHAMAPEQWNAGGDARSDLYSIGCLLYEMLGGRSPFVIRGAAAPQDRIMRLAHMHMHQLAPRLSALAPDTPLGLVRFVHALLEKRPEDRPQTAQQAVKLLDRALYGDELEELASSVPQGIPADLELEVAHGDTMSMSTSNGPIDMLAATMGVEQAAALAVDPGAHTIAPSSAPLPFKAPAAAVSGVFDPAANEPSVPAQQVALPEVVASPETPEAPTAREATRAPRRPTNWRRIARVVTVCVLLAVGAGFWWVYGRHRLPAALSSMMTNVQAATSDMVELPSAPPADLDGPVSPDDEGRGARPEFIYRARLGPRDHRTGRGAKIRHAEDIVLRDRINYHGDQRDAGDEPDPLLNDAHTRRKLRTLLTRALSKSLRKRIIDGTPLIEVQVWADYATVTLIAD